VPPRTDAQVFAAPKYRDILKGFNVSPARMAQLRALPLSQSLAIIEEEHQRHVEWATRLHDFLTTELVEHPLDTLPPDGGRPPYAEEDE
jgi:hypothetical protein